jgi:hypothetical protein
MATSARPSEDVARDRFGGRPFTALRQDGALVAIVSSSRKAIVEVEELRTRGRFSVGADRGSRPDLRQLGGLRPVETATASGLER